MVVNYGLERVRFPAPVPSGARVRATVEPLKVQTVEGGGVQLHNRVTVHTDGGDKPCCVAETLTRLYA